MFQFLVYVQQCKIRYTKKKGNAMRKLLLNYHSKYTVFSSARSPLQGHEDSKSNFVQLLRLQNQDQPVSHIEMFNGF